MTAHQPRRPSGEAALAALGEASAAALVSADVEAALHHLCRVVHDTLGDHAAARRPGSLKPGERDRRVAGVFLVSPDQTANVLVGNVGFPPEQRRLTIPIAWNHPGWVVAHQAPLLLENTDEHAAFRQFLKSGRMGSSIYAPILVGDRMIGQIVGAAQARWTYGTIDLGRLRAIAAVAALVWTAHDGDAWLARDYPAADAWRAEDHVSGEAIG